MSREAMMKKLGLKKEDFEPSKITTEERVEAIEEAITELAEILLGGEE